MTIRRTPWRAAALVIWLSSAACQSQGARDVASIRQGSDELRRGRFASAATMFRQVGRASSVSGIASFDLGIAEARQQRMDEAVDAFRQAAALLTVDEQRSRAHYNLGVVLATRADLRDAADAFEAALRLMPGDEDARVNLAIVLDRLRRARPPGPPPPAPEDVRRAIADAPNQLYSLPVARRSDRAGPIVHDW